MYFPFYEVGIFPCNWKLRVTRANWSLPVIQLDKQFCLWSLYHKLYFGLKAQGWQRTQRTSRATSQEFSVDSVKIRLECGPSNTVTQIPFLDFGGGEVNGEMKYYSWALCVCALSWSVVSNSLWPHGLQPARLLCPWDSLAKNTGVGCHALRGSPQPRDQMRIAYRFFTLSHLGSP